MEAEVEVEAKGEVKVGFAPVGTVEAEVEAKGEVEVEARTSIRGSLLESASSADNPVLRPEERVDKSGLVSMITSA